MLRPTYTCRPIQNVQINCYCNQFIITIIIILVVVGGIVNLLLSIFITYQIIICIYDGNSPHS